jgi:uncharacterized membrane protein YidH (DUF202 family)
MQECRGKARLRLLIFFFSFAMSDSTAGLLLIGIVLTIGLLFSVGCTTTLFTVGRAVRDHFKIPEEVLLAVAIGGVFVFTVIMNRWDKAQAHQKNY